MHRANACAQLSSGLEDSSVTARFLGSIVVQHALLE